MPATGCSAGPVCDSLDRVTTEGVGWDLITRRVARAGGLRDRDVAALIGMGAWQRIRRGAYCGTPGPEFPEESHALLVRATAPLLGGGSTCPVVSHASAAVLHGLPVWGADLAKVHVTRPGSPGVAGTGVVRPHRAEMQDDEMVLVDGVTVTSIARTILDLARTYGFECGVVTADAALHAGRVTTDELRTVVERARARRSAGVAPRVVDFADPLAESVGESRSRVLFARVGLPQPALQRDIRSDDGHLIGRVDFDFDQFRTVGEFDGLRKYRRDLRPGERPEDAVVREKLREDEIRDTDRQMVRWTWREIGSPIVVLQRFVRAFARAGFADWEPCPGPPWRRGA